MFGNWFTDAPTGTGTDAGQNNLPANDEPMTPGTSVGISSVPHASSILPSNSPHDDMTSEIDNELRNLQSAAGKTSPPMFRSRELPENVYDPFDGQSIGLLIPGEFEESEDDIWTHLAEIRNLQSDIARMHAQMERLGENVRIYGQGHTGEDDTVNMEDEAKAEKAAEFAKLSDRFNNRKEAIDAIMQKLQTLSSSINDFHSSRAPVFRSPTSSSRTGDNKYSDNRATVSNQSKDAPGQSIMNDRILASMEHPLKDSPESMNRSVH